MFGKIKEDWNHPGSTLNVETDDPRHEQLFPCGAESVFYFVWFPLTECKVLSASCRLFPLLWSLVAALEPAAKRLVLQILNLKNLQGVQVFVYVHFFDICPILFKSPHPYRIFGLLLRWGYLKSIF